MWRRGREDGGCRRRPWPPPSPPGKEKGTRKKRKGKGGVGWEKWKGRKGREESIDLGFQEKLPNCPSVYIYLLFQFNSYILANCETKL